MNITFSSLLLMISLSLTFLTISCVEDDPCDGVTCFNGGSCEDGDCDCSTAFGYEGAMCETEVNDKFTEFSMLMESCSNAQPRTITISISERVTSPITIRFDGLANGFFQADGIIDGAIGRDFTIPRAGFGGQEIEGSGTMRPDGSAIDISYSIYDPANPQTPEYTCTGIITK